MIIAGFAATNAPDLTEGCKVQVSAPPSVFGLGGLKVQVARRARNAGRWGATVHMAVPPIADPILAEAADQLAPHRLKARFLVHAADGIFKPVREVQVWQVVS